MLKYFETNITVNYRGKNWLNKNIEGVFKNNDLDNKKFLGTQTIRGIFTSKEAFLNHLEKVGVRMLQNASSFIKETYLLKTKYVSNLFSRVYKPEFFITIGEIKIINSEDISADTWYKFFTKTQLYFLIANGKIKINH